jgi:hypothetical protein
MLRLLFLLSILPLLLCFLFGHFFPFFFLFCFFFFLTDNVLLSCPKPDGICRELRTKYEYLLDRALLFGQDDKCLIDAHFGYHAYLDGGSISNPPFA